MKNIKIHIFLALLVGFSFVSSVNASDVFVNPLKYGTKNSSEVIKLQDFLRNKGYLNYESTGNFFELTKKAVIAFQIANNLPATGYFGPMSIKVANGLMTGVANIVGTNPSKVSVTSIEKSNSNVASVLSSNLITIKWQHENYPTGVGININLLKKTSDSPTSYTLVKQIYQNIENDGQESWTPSQSDLGNDTYIEVTCSTENSFKSGCVSGNPVKLK